MPKLQPEFTSEKRKIRKKKGKRLRQNIPHKSHGKWSAASERPDPLELLQEQDQGRIQQLLPIRYGRMLESPFTFYRGSAGVMAADLVASPVTGINTMLCGDAHLSNFGMFASPERSLVFDINDFDEAFPGPWEWDLKRLAASAVIAGRDNGFSEKACRQLAEDTALTYCRSMDHFTRLSTLDQWYYHVKLEALEKVFKRSSKKGRKGAVNMVEKARKHTLEQTLKKMTRLEKGQLRLVSDPPLVVPYRDMILGNYLDRKDLKSCTRKRLQGTWQNYLDSLPDERRYLLGQYKVIDAALRVGGIGSVGTRCFIALLMAKNDDDAIILQFKEAGPSVLEPWLKRRGRHKHSGQRVVTAQRGMQATSDTFLGCSHGEQTGLDYYWRQLKDMKGSADIATLDEEGLRTYLSVCSWTLARAHARTGDEIAIRGYVGKSETFPVAVATFAVAYGDQAERDYEVLLKAVKAGRIPVEKGV